MLEEVSRGHHPVPTPGMIGQGEPPIRPDSKQGPVGISIRQSTSPDLPVFLFSFSVRLRLAIKRLVRGTRSIRGRFVAAENVLVECLRGGLGLDVELLSQRRAPVLVL